VVFEENILLKTVCILVILLQKNSLFKQIGSQSLTPTSPSLPEGKIIAA
jgi:hypothetical protein